jgi:pyrimidine-specific ribonucleoside hydrolase
VLGISTVFGNTSIENVYEIAGIICQKYSSYEIPHYKGAATAIQPELVEHNEATLALAKSLVTNKLKILAIGPATNVAIVILKNPELAKNIEEVVLVAGRRKPTDYFNIGEKGNRAPDLNFDLDNLAFVVMFQAGVPVTLSPFEISSKV